MKNMTPIFTGLVMLVMADQAGAVSLSLSPSVQNAVTGDSITLDLMIEGLGDFSPDSLGAFDVDILYDTSVLTFQSYTLGLSLGDPSLFEAIDSSLGDLAGTIDLAETSLLWPDELDALQPSSFVLASLDFSVDSLLAGQSTVVGIDALDSFLYLSDAFGQPLALDGVSDAVIRNPVSVSEPSLLLLMGLGLLGLAVVDRKRSYRKPGI